MRAIISKVLTGSLIAGAALAVSACGPKTETTTENTMVTDMNTTDDTGTMSDNMTAVDGSANGGMMANDTDTMGNDTMTTSNTTTTNAM